MNSEAESIGAIVVLAIIFLPGLWRRISGKTSVVAARNALVAKEAKVSTTGPVYVRLVGRKPGIFAWILSLIGISPVTTLEVMEDRVEFTEGSLSGRLTHMLPLCSVCNLGAGYTKPFFLFVIGVVLVIGAFATMCVGNMPGAVPVFHLFFAAVAFVAYYLKKTLTLFFLPASSLGAVMGLKRSVIEGVNIDEKLAFKVIDIVSGLIERNAGAPGDASDGTLSVRCPRCGESLALPRSAFGSKVQCPACGTKFMSDTMQII